MKLNNLFSFIKTIEFRDIILIIMSIAFIFTIVFNGGSVYKKQIKDLTKELETKQERWSFVEDSLNNAISNRDREIELRNDRIADYKKELDKKSQSIAENEKLAKMTAEERKKQQKLKDEMIKKIKNMPNDEFLKFLNKNL